MRSIGIQGTVISSIFGLPTGIPVDTPEVPCAVQFLRAEIEEREIF